MRLSLAIVRSTRAAEFSQQLIDQISDAVATGVLRPGDRLDTIQAVSDMLQIAHATVGRAYVALEARGVIETARRKGSFIADVPTSLLNELRVEYAQRVLAPNVQHLACSGLRPTQMLEALRDLINAFDPATRDTKTSTNKSRKVSRKVR